MCPNPLSDQNDSRSRAMDTKRLAKISVFFTQIRLEKEWFSTSSCYAGVK